MTFGSSGFATAPFAAENVADIGAATAPLSIVVYQVDIGAATAPLSIVVYQVDIGAATAPLSITVAPRTGAATAPLRLSIYTTGTASAPLAIVVAPPAAFASGGLWRPVVVMGGVDVSAQLTGEITIDAGEGSARIAEFTLAPPAGAITPLAWIGKPVAISYAMTAADGSALYPQRLFTGVVDTPEYDVVTKLAQFRCTDDLQNAVGNLSSADVDALAGGYWSAAVFDPLASIWQRLRDRMATVPGSVDRSPNGALRNTPWRARSTPDLTFDTSTIEEASLKFGLAQRADVRNRVDITFSYRYPIYKLRVISCGWNGLSDLAGYVKYGYAVPTRAQIKQALDATGWEYLGDINWTPVPAGPLTVNLGGASAIWIVTDANLGACTTIGDKTALNLSAQYAVGEPGAAEKLTFGFVCRMQKRYVQQAEEMNTIIVENVASSSTIGVLGDSIGASLAVDAGPAQAWEAWKPTLYPAGSYRPPSVADAPPPPVLVPGPYTREIATEYMPDPTTDRAAASAAIATLIAQAQTTIQASHRRSFVEFGAPLNPAIDLDKTVRVSTSAVTAKGKVRRVLHKMSMAGGRAETHVEVAISALTGIGLGAAATGYASAPIRITVGAGGDPAQFSASAGNWIGQSITSAPFDAEGMIGFCSNRAQPLVLLTPESFEWSATPRYPEQFSFRVPEIDAASRNNLILPIVQSIAAEVIEDEFTVIN